MKDGTTGLVAHRGAVYPRDCDHIGHMNIATYGVKFDQANWVLFCELGLTPSYMRGEFGMAGVQQNISYQQELFAGDVIEVRSHVLEVAEKRLVIRHEMRKIDTGEFLDLKHTSIIDLLVSFRPRSSFSACRKVRRTSRSGH